MTKRKMKIRNDEGVVEEVSEVGVPGLFPPGEWDLQEECQRLDSFLEYEREKRLDKNDV